ncbi:MAG: YybH family protein [Terriglobales bacterium]
MARRCLVLTFAFVLLASLHLTAQYESDPKTDAVRAVLDAQVAAWNRDDLESFMAGYWRSPDLEFYSGDTITLGWEQTLARYKQRYQSQGHEMGHLDFSELHVHTNASNVAWVSGRWHLKMKDGSERGGLFTLIFHKMPEGWKIIHDHTS